MFELTHFNSEQFFTDSNLSIKAVLFTKKHQCPPLWRQVAKMNAHSAAFAIVKSKEDEVLTRFGLEMNDLPRVILFFPGRRMVYDGPHELGRLNEFLNIAASISLDNPTASKSAHSMFGTDWVPLDVSEMAELQISADTRPR